MLPNALRLIQVGLASLIVAAAFRAPKRGFVFDFGGRVFHAGPYWLLAVAVLVVSYLRHEQVARFVARIPRVVLDALFFVAAFLLVKRFTYGAFGAFPQIQDEISYDLLARRISIGQPIPASHPLFEFFRMRFLVEDGRSYPLFQPGWPLLLAVFWKLHAPGLAPAFATAMLVVAGSRLADRLYGRVASVLAGLLLLASGFLHVVGGAYFAHTLAAALLCFGLEGLHFALVDPDPRRAHLGALFGGIASAWLVITRLPTALTLFFGIVVGVLVFAVRFPAPTPGEPRFARFRRPSVPRAARRPLLVFVCLAALGPLTQAAWNVRTTGHALELPQDRYFAQTEDNPDCHRLGFGDEVGCGREHPKEVPPEGYTLERAMQVTTMRWNVFRVDAWGTGWPIALAALFVLRSRKREDALVVVGTLAPLAVYYAFYYHAIQHGARLYTDLMGPLAVAIAAGLTLQQQSEGDAPPSKAWQIASALGTMILALVVVDELRKDIPNRIKDINRQRQAERVQENVDKTNAHHAIVYVQNCVEPDRGDVVYGWPSVLNTPRLWDGDRVYVRSFDIAHDRQMVTMYPTWHHQRVDCIGRPLPFPFAQPTPSRVVVEGEAKFPPDTRVDSYAQIEGLPEASNRQFLKITLRSPKANIVFRQYLFEEGDYQISAEIPLRFDSGRFALVVDGTVLAPPLDGRGAKSVLHWNAAGKLHLAAGTHRVEVRSLEGIGTFVHALDRIEFSK